jgi:hypothetical protein
MCQRYTFHEKPRVSDVLTLVNYKLIAKSFIRSGISTIYINVNKKPRVNILLQENLFLILIKRLAKLYAGRSSNRLNIYEKC